MGLGDVVPQGEYGTILTVCLGWMLTGLWSTAFSLDLLILVTYIQSLFEGNTSSVQMVVLYLGTHNTIRISSHVPTNV